MPMAHAAQRRRLDAEAAQRRIQHQVVERDQQHHQQRIERLHLRRLNQLGLVIAAACNTQVDAFWSNSDQNGVISANTIRMRSTARTPSTASSGWRPRARSSCSHAPRRRTRSAHQREAQADHEARSPPMSANAASASDRRPPSTARSRPARPALPARRAPAARCAPRSGTNPDPSARRRRPRARTCGGPARTPGGDEHQHAGNAEGHAGPVAAQESTGMSSEAKNEPKLMIQ
jgi:hypothetical protein